MITINTPAIAPGTTEQRLQQIQTYLFQTAQTLQWAFDSISSAESSAAQRTTPGGAQVPSKAPTEKTPEETFASIKNLIIKSADIVNAYSTIIEQQFSGSYVSSSDFGEYKEATQATLRATDKNVEQLYTNVQEITGVLGSLTDQVNKTSAYIKTGYLGDSAEGLPVYGVEVGQKVDVGGKPVFDKFARFSAGRLSFFDEASTEVAYVSDYKMYITNAEITGALYLSGKFKIYYNNGLCFQWRGKDGLTNGTYKLR